MRFLRTRLLLLGVLLFAPVGCRPEDGIHQETVTHPDRQALRLRVAILERGDTVWFIRIDGPEELVSQHQKTFDGFVRSTEFSNKKDDPEPLKWKTPDGWKKDPPSPPGMGRYAVYRIDVKPKELEVKITNLPARGYELMPNMHRWQKQIDVKLSELAADNEPYLQEDTIGNQRITWVDMKGLGVHNVSKPFDPNAAHQNDVLGGLGNEGKGKQPFKYTAPAGWVKKPLVEFAVAVYEVSDGKSSAAVTLSSARGDLATNLNRWRGQVGLAKLPDDEVVKTVKNLLVAGVQSSYADIANPDGPAKKNRILGVIVPLGQTKWFIKMTGPNEFVGQHKKAFETFVESFKK